MKKSIANVEKSNEKHSIHMIKDWKIVKKFVAYIKRTGNNFQHPLRFASEQEVEIRFRTVCEVTERFMKSAEKVAQLLDESTAKECNLLHTAMQDGGTQFYLHLSTVSPWFSPIGHIQTALGSSITTTLHLAYALPKKLKFLLKRILFCGMATDDIRSSQKLFFATILLSKQEYIKNHGLWPAASMLNPRMRDSSFQI